MSVKQAFISSHWCKRLVLAGLTLLAAPALSLSVLSSTPVYAQSAAVRQGYTLLSQNRVNEAINAFQAILRQNPRDIDAQLGLGISYRRAGRDADALATYQRVLELEPNNRLALSSLGFLGEFRAEWQPIGIQALTRLLDLEPNNLDARAQRAKLYYYQGLFSQSLADYALVLPQTQNLDVVGAAAEAYTYSGDYATGLSLFNRYQTVGGAVRGDQAIAYAQALRESGSVAQAVQVLESELSRTPESNTQQARLRGALATAYAANAQYQQALEVIQPLRGRNDARLTLARALNAVGEYSRQTGYSQEAAQIYQTVLTTAPNLPVGVRREAVAVFSNLPEWRPFALQLVQALNREFPNDSSLVFSQQVLAYQLGQLSRTDFVRQVQAAFPSLPGDPAQVRSIGQTLSRVDPPVAELLPLYQSLLAAGSPEGFLNFRVAQILIQQGQLAAAKSALAAYAGTPAGQRDAETTQLLLADIDRREGNINASIQRYQALISSSRTLDVRRGALQGLAAVYQSQGLNREAIALYDQIIAENPQDPTFALGRTALAYQTGLISEAQAAAVLNQSLQQYGASTPPPELITLVAALPPDPSRADLYQRLLTVEPNNLGLQLRSLQVLADRNPTQATAEVARLIAQAPNNLDLYFVQGDIAQQTGDEALARQSYATILQRQPNNLDALLALGGLEFQQGNLDQANELYNRALALDTTSGVARTSLAALNAVQGRPLQAIKELRAWQQFQQAQGVADPQVSAQIQQIEAGLLQQRGIQPPWERF
ncbi:MAG: tetratricopeptide repeat protein [Cyanobacteria bacterium Co-bin13]|nr:tetratricopeptide repeat protein [Cyanobacteria bacterium Co-bin13]